MIYGSDTLWLDRSFKLSSKFDPFLSSMADEVASATGKRRKADGVENIKTALSVIFANLLRQYALRPSVGIQIDLSNDGYPKEAYNPYCLGVRAVQKAVRYLRRSSPPLVKKTGGNFDHRNNSGHITQVWPTDRLIDILLSFNLRLNTISNYTNNIIFKPITRNTFRMDTYIEHYNELFEKADLPTIRLRETSSKKRGRFVDFGRTPETDRLHEKLNAFNSFLASYGCLNLFVTEDEEKEVLKGKAESVDSFGHPVSDSRMIDLVSRNKLHRVFNDGTFDHGGRFYGCWWQDVRKKYRPLITINGVPTVEVDFSGMQLAMLYAKVGQQLDGDPYAIAGIGSKFRPLIKETTLKMINAKERMRPALESKLPEGVSFEDLQAAILAKHKPIAEFFHSGEGVRLQRIDADIAEDVMHRMMGRGIIVLPVHDSFIVEEEHTDFLTATMIDAYQQRMGGYTITVKRSQSLIDDLLAGVDGLDADERYGLGLELFEIEKQRPEYDGYRRREELLGRGRPSEEKRKIRLPERMETVPNRASETTGLRAKIVNFRKDVLSSKQSACGTGIWAE